MAMLRKETAWRSVVGLSIIGMPIKTLNILIMNKVSISFLLLISVGVMIFNIESVKAEYQWPNRYPTQNELNKRIPSAKKSIDFLKSERMYGSQLRKNAQKMDSFRKAWSQVIPYASFLGSWGGEGDANFSIYPTPTENQVCVMVEGWARSYSAHLSVGKLMNGQIKTSGGLLGKATIIHLNESSLGMGTVDEHSISLNPSVGAFELKNPQKLPFSNSQKKQEFLKEFNRLGCTNAIP
jgi:hypothetical protein